MTRPINQITRHFKDKDVKSVKVPEWGQDEDHPLIVYYEPLTVRGKDKLHRMNKDYGDSIEWLVMVLIHHALDAQGNPLFTLEDKKDFMHYADVRVVERVAAAILLDGGSYEEEKKN